MKIRRVEVFSFFFKLVDSFYRIFSFVIFNIRGWLKNVKINLFINERRFLQKFGFSVKSFIFEEVHNIMLIFNFSFWLIPKSLKRTANGTNIF